MLVTTHEELLAAIGNELQLAKEVLEFRAKEEVDSLRAEVKEIIRAHEESADRRLTQFLEKQNALIENLTQQIDGCTRRLQAQSADLDRLSTQCTALTTSVTTVEARLDPLEGAMGDPRTGIKAQAKRLANLEDLAGKAKTLLDGTIKKLQEGWGGKKFK
jgi:chromosome segregation ATPase